MLSPQAALAARWVSGGQSQLSAQPTSQGSRAASGSGSPPRRKGEGHWSQQQTRDSSCAASSHMEDVCAWLMLFSAKLSTLVKMPSPLGTQEATAVRSHRCRSHLVIVNGGRGRLLRAWPDGQ